MRDKQPIHEFINLIVAQVNDFIFTDQISAMMLQLIGYTNKS